MRESQKNNPVINGQDLLNSSLTMMYKFSIFHGFGYVALTSPYMMDRFS